MDKKVVIFAGNEPARDKERYLYLAHQVGQLLAAAGFVTVTGAGSGLMEAAAKGAFEAGGRTMGIGLDIEGRKQSLHLHDYEAFKNLMPRQGKLIASGDAFLALPGGVGTVFEIFNIVALKRLKELEAHKPLVILGDYYRPLRELLAHMMAAGFLEKSAQELYYFASQPEEAVKYIQEHL